MLFGDTTGVRKITRCRLPPHRVRLHALSHAVILSPRGGLLGPPKPTLRVSSLALRPQDPSHFGERERI